MEVLPMAVKEDDIHKMVKKIVIFGATGRTGLCATESALKKGLQVRTFARNMDRLPPHLAAKVEKFAGDVLDQEAVNKACAGVDAVVICIGTNDSLDPTTDMSEGTKRIINAMKKHNLTVVSACLSSFLHIEPEPMPPRYLHLSEDHRRMYNELKNSPLHYVAVFAPHISNEPSSDVIIEINKKQRAGPKISKYDLGKFLIDCLDDPKYYRATIGIANDTSHKKF